MQITPPSTGTLPGLTVTLANNQPAPWQPGQVVSARVLDVTPDGHLSLMVHGQAVDARSPLPLTAGAQLKLMVELDAGHIVLRILNDVPQQQALAAAWRTALPKQLPLATALQALVRLMRSLQAPLAAAQSDGNATPQSPVGVGAPPTPLPQAADILSLAESAAPALTEGNQAAQPVLSPKVQQLLHALLEQLPTVEQLTTADGLQTALRESGLLLQARLAQGDSSALEHDLQSTLLRLSAAVAKELAAPPATTSQTNGDATRAEVLQHTSQTLQQVAQQIDGALAHLKVQQLHTLTTRNDTTTVWLFDVPMRQGQELDVLQLRIQRESRNKDDGAAPTWSVRLHFDMPRYGTIDSMVNLIGSKIGVMFWSETPTTADLLQQHMEALRAQLQQAGLDIEQLRSTVGAAPKVETPEAAAGGLLHLRA